MLPRLNRIATGAMLRWASSSIAVISGVRPRYEHSSLPRTIPALPLRVRAAPRTDRSPAKLALLRREASFIEGRPA